MISRHYKSACRNCNGHPYMLYPGSTYEGYWIGCCINVRTREYNYEPKDNLEWMEWKYEKSTWVK